MDSLLQFSEIKLEDNNSTKDKLENEIPKISDKNNKEDTEDIEDENEEEENDENKKSISFEITFLDRSGGPSEILDDFLFLGAGRDANNASFITEKKITHVLSMISAYKPTLAYSETAKSSNARILVHCAAGISRSSTIIIAYLMKSHNMSLREAYELVLSRRKIIRPNDGFFEQLQQLESELFGKSTMAISELPFVFRKPRTPANSLFSPSKSFSSHEEGLEWAERVIGEGLLDRILNDTCGGVYIAEKTTDFLDSVLSDAKALPEVTEKEKEGYKWPKLSINIMKRASSWYKSKKPSS